MSSSAFNRAAEIGDLVVMAWLREQGCRFDCSAYAAAARSGHVHVLDWMYAHYEEELSELHMSDEACSDAALGNHTAALSWLVAHGCAFDRETASFAAMSGKLDTLEWIHANRAPNGYLLEIDDEYSAIGVDVCQEAARNGHVHVLEWVLANGGTWDDQAWSSAAFGGQLATLEWLLAKSTSSTPPLGLDDHMCTSAAQSGSLDVLKWLRQHGCPWGHSVCKHAARNGHIQMLQWARRSGCNWDHQTCDAAAQGGFLDVLKWAVANQCPLSSQTTVFAATNGHTEVLEWLVSAGCAMGENIVETAHKSGALYLCRRAVLANMTGFDTISLSTGHWLLQAHEDLCFAYSYMFQE
jgi:hypothetical protein